MISANVYLQHCDLFISVHIQPEHVYSQNSELKRRNFSWKAYADVLSSLNKISISQDATDQQNALCCGEQIVTSISIIIWVSGDSRRWVHLSTLMNLQQLPGRLQITRTGGSEEERKARGRINLPARPIRLRRRQIGTGVPVMSHQVPSDLSHGESATEERAGLQKPSRPHICRFEYQKRDLSAIIIFRNKKQVWRDQLLRAWRR